jgi:hypothetical protein
MAAVVWDLQARPGGGRRASMHVSQRLPSSIVHAVLAPHSAPGPGLVFARRPERVFMLRHRRSVSASFGFRVSVLGRGTPRAAFGKCRERAWSARSSVVVFASHMLQRSAGRGPRKLRFSLFAPIFAASVSLFLLTGTAQGQSNPAAIAETLFDEGRRLLSEGQVDAALHKFTESQRLDPSPGTLLNVALCYRLLGKMASSWATYRDAGRLALVRGRQEVVEEAEAQARLLEPHISYVTLVVSTPVPAIEITMDGVPIRGAAVGTPLPADPGTHRFRASAPGHEQWSASVKILPEKRIKITVPPLRPLAQATRPQLWPWITTGAGLGTLGAGAVFGILAKVEYDSALAKCDEQCDSSAQDHHSNATTFADVSTVLFPIGAALTTVGVTWLVLNQKSHSHGPTSRLAVQFPSGLAVSYEGAF